VPNQSRGRLTGLLERSLGGVDELRRRRGGDFESDGLLDRLRGGGDLDPDEDEYRLAVFGRTGDLELALDAESESESLLDSLSLLSDRSFLPGISKA
jgi:hypothetical protein